MISDKQAMWKALQIAKKGLGWVEPNPPVGCVILDKNHQLLSSGYHKKYGGDHAEIQALKKVKDKTRLEGAHVYVTLEPCHHIGKTPSCSLALAQYPIKSLMYGTKDPFTANHGLEYLEAQKVNIRFSPYFQEELTNLVKPFTFSGSHKKAFVSLTMGASLDGVIALETGQSQWITNEHSREHSHFLRATHSAILIGVNTLIQDNPKLNIRISPFLKKANKVIILDPRGRSFPVLPNSQVVKSHPTENIFVFSFAKNSSSSVPDGIQYRLLKKENDKNSFCLSSLMERLYQEENIQSVLVEGGGITISHFLKEQAAQKLYLYIAPCIIGKGIRWSEELKIQKLSHRLIVNSIKLQSMGTDFLLEGDFKDFQSSPPQNTLDDFKTKQ